MKKLLVLTLILALAAPVAMAQPGPGGRGDCDRPGFGQKGMHRGMGQHDGMPGMRAILAHADDLKLTEQQVDKLEKMQTDFQTQRVDKKAALEKAEINLHALMRDDAGEAQIFAAIDQVSKLKADMKKMPLQPFSAGQRRVDSRTSRPVERISQKRQGHARSETGMPGSGSRPRSRTGPRPARWLIRYKSTTEADFSSSFYSHYSKKPATAGFFNVQPIHNLGKNKGWLFGQSGNFRTK